MRAVNEKNCASETQNRNLLVYKATDNYPSKCTDVNGTTEKNSLSILSATYEYGTRTA
jgi:hypothetical protein